MKRLVSAAVLVLVGCYIPLADGAIRGQAGLIRVVPGAVVVAVGGSTRLDVVVLGPDGAPVDPAPSLAFRSDDQAIATVGADGRVAGVAIGETTVEVDAGSFGILRVPASVRASVHAGPVVMTCRPSVVATTVGGLVLPDIVFTDATGAPVPDDGITLFLDDETVATIEGGAVRGVAQGVTTLGARGPDGEPLAGLCNVVVVPSGASTGGRCEDVYVDMCWIEFAPYYFARPGSSAPFAVRAGSFRVAGCGLPEGHFGTVQPPDSVVPEAPGVIGYFGGALRALAPGRTRYRAYWGDADCGEARATVGADLGGTWQMRCDNGDYGVLSLGSTGGGTLTNTRGGMTVALAGSTGTGSICSTEPTAMICTDRADGYARHPEPFSGQGTCESAGGCTNVSVSHCGNRGTGAAILESHDRMRAGDCVYTRGGGSAVVGQCESSEVCTAVSRPCFGVDVQSCAATDFSRCYVVVGGRTFECGTCPAPASCIMEAAQYGAMLCR